MPDRRLIYSMGKAIWMTEPLETVARLIGELGGDDSGGADRLAVSPDGSRLAFDYLDEVRILDLAADEVFTLPVAETYDFVRVHSPAWSPDGTHLAVKVEGTGVIWDANVNTVPYGADVVITDALGIVPADFGRTRSEDGTTDTELHIVRSRTAMTLGDDDGELEADVFSKKDTLMWWLR